MRQWARQMHARANDFRRWSVRRQKRSISRYSRRFVATYTGCRSARSMGFSTASRPRFRRKLGYHQSGRSATIARLLRYAPRWPQIFSRSMSRVNSSTFLRTARPSRRSPRRSRVYSELRLGRRASVRPMFSPCIARRSERHQTLRRAQSGLTSRGTGSRVCVRPSQCRRSPLTHCFLIYKKQNSRSRVRMLCIKLGRRLIRNSANFSKRETFVKSRNPSFSAPLQVMEHSPKSSPTTNFLISAKQSVRMSDASSSRISRGASMEHSASFHTRTPCSMSSRPNAASMDSPTLDVALRVRRCEQGRALEIPTRFGAHSVVTSVILPSMRHRTPRWSSSSR